MDTIDSGMGGALGLRLGTGTGDEHRSERNEHGDNDSVHGDD